ncbi:MAG: hypothetical protein R2911_10820 [Caldilineaceae bacterium]
MIRAEYEHYVWRMCWGSDYPVVRFYMTYRQALEAFRTHYLFYPRRRTAVDFGATRCTSYSPGPVRRRGCF